MQKSNFPAVLFAMLFAVTTLFPAIAMAQNSTNEKLRKSTLERGLESLLDAIDTGDGGNSNTVRLRGMLPSGSEPHSVLLQIASDDRVRKIYSLLNAMPQQQAAEIVSRSYNKSLSKLQTLARSGKGDDSLSYGLHAKLWLSYQFEQRADFNRRFNDWNDWYVDRLASKKFLTVNKEVPAPIRKVAFARSSSPEMLMYLNLALIDQVKNGKVDDQSEYAKTLQEAGLSWPLSQSYAMLPVLPFDSELDAEKSKDVEPLLTLPFFLNWGGLDALDIEERIELTSKVRNLVDENGKFDSALEDITLSLLSLGGTVDLKRLQADLDKLQKMKSSKGTAIAFLGSSQKKPLVHGWYAEHPPSKQELMKAVDRLVSLTPPDELDQWEANIEELIEWLSEIPESGIEEKKQKVLVWPQPDEKESDANAKSEPAKLSIRLVLKKTKAFAGKMTDEDDSQSGNETDDDK